MFLKMLLVGRLISDSISQLVGRIAFDRLWVGLLKSELRRLQVQIVA